MMMDVGRRPGKSGRGEIQSGMERERDIDREMQSLQRRSDKS